MADVVNGVNLSVAVAVGFIALAGVAAETGVIMLIYLDHAVEHRTQVVDAEAEPSPARTSMPPSWRAPSSGCR